MNVAVLPEHDPKSAARSSRRTILSLALGAALGGIGVPVGVAVAKPKRTPRAGGKPKADARRQPKRRPKRRPKPRYKVVTRTFASSTPITIPGSGSANPYPATIQVGGLRAGTILDVNVTLSGLSHDDPRYVEVVLVAPGGRTAVVLMSDAGSSFTITNVTLVFDDQAASVLPFKTQIVSGSFKPTFPVATPTPETARLGMLTDLNPNGTWRLYVADGATGDEGSIDGWSLTIRARVRV